MTIDDALVRDRRVAVGPTRESAAAAFGRADDDVFVTTYEDVDREVDLDRIAQLDLVLAPDGHRTIAAACARLHAGGPPVRVAVRLPVQPGGADVLERARVEVSGLEAGDGVVVLRLGPGPTDHAHLGLLLRALDAGDAAGRNRLAAPATSVVAPRADRRRPRPLLVEALTRVDRWRTGRRRQGVLVGATVVVAGLLLLGLLPDSPRVLVSVGVPLLLVLVVLGAVTSSYVTLLLARQVHRQTGQLERMTLRNRSVVNRRTNALARRLDRVEQAQSRLPFLEQYVEAVAEHNAASDARLRDLLETLGSIEPGRLVDPRHDDG